MKKIRFCPDKRAVGIFKICTGIVAVGIILSLMLYLNTPTNEMASVCKQMLFGCAFGFDIAVGALLYMEYLFKKEDVKRL